MTHDIIEEFSYHRCCSCDSCSRQYYQWKNDCRRHGWDIRRKQIVEYTVDKDCDKYNGKCNDNWHHNERAWKDRSWREDDNDCRCTKDYDCDRCSKCTCHNQDKCTCGRRKKDFREKIIFVDRDNYNRHNKCTCRNQDKCTCGNRKVAKIVIEEGGRRGDRRNDRERILIRERDNNRPEIIIRSKNHRSHRDNNDRRYY